MVETVVNKPRDRFTPPETSIRPLAVARTLYVALDAESGEERLFDSFCRTIVP
jgi:hypothetical protein